MKPNLIHLHGDPKFISEVELYSTELFSNKLVFTGNPNDLSGEYKTKALSLSSQGKDRINELLQICKDANIVILNNLDALFVNIALALPKDVIIIWRFFGNEIYSNHPQLIFSERSLETWKAPIQKLSILNQVKHHVKELISTEDRFKLAMERVNYFMGIMDDEYEYLKSLGYKLPPFLQFPFNPIWAHNIIFKKDEQIIFGNSRNRANNHLNILDLFKNIELSPRLQIKMFFSYGSQGEYAEVVKENSQEISQIELIEEFLDQKRFQGIYVKSAALIFNGYRQMAMTNIITAVMTGVKIYLSERNVTYDWLNKIGVKVYSIESDLVKDLKEGQIYLNNDLTLSNMKNMVEFAQANSKEKFNKHLLEILS